MTDFKEVNTTQHVSGQEGRLGVFKATQLIWLMLGILEVLLALRFMFKLIGVNAANTIATLLYGITDLFISPFVSLTGAPAAGGMVFEFSTLIAMVVYALLGWALAQIIYVLFYRPRGPVSTRQTVVSDHIPSESTDEVSKTTVTEHTTQ